AGDRAWVLVCRRLIGRILLRDKNKRTAGRCAGNSGADRLVRSRPPGRLLASIADIRTRSQGAGWGPGGPPNKSGTHDICCSADLDRALDDPEHDPDGESRRSFG